MNAEGNYSGGNSGHGKRKKSGAVIALTTIAALLLFVISVFMGVIVYNQFLKPSVNPTVAATQAPTTAAAGETKALTVTQQTTAPTEGTTVPTTLPYVESGKDIINILIVGQAARDGEESRMADTMILATVNKNTKVLTLTSFLRDTYLKLPDYVDPSGTRHTCGKQRINLAYHLGWTWGDVGGAMEMTNQCLYENFGIEVDYDVEVDFRAFIDVINLLGGLTVELTEAEADYLNTDGKVWQDVTAGKVCLDGDTALAYARMRKAEGDHDSDIKRTDRQQKVIQAILKQVKNLPFTELQELVKAALPSVTTNMTNEEITTCMWEILPLLPQLTVETGTCPVETTYWGEIIEIGGYPSSVLFFDEGQNRKLMTAITEGTSD